MAVPQLQYCPLFGYDGSCNVVITTDRFKEIIDHSPIIFKILEKIKNEIHFAQTKNWVINLISFEDASSCIDSENGSINVVAISKKVALSFIKIEYQTFSQFKPNFYQEAKLLKHAQNFIHCVNLKIAEQAKKQSRKRSIGFELFRSPVYKAVHTKILGFFDRYCEKYPYASFALSPFFSELRSLSVDSGYEVFHKLFLKRIREIWTEKKVPTLEYAERHNFIKELSYWLFTEVNIDDECWNYLKEKCGYQSDPADLSMLTNIYYSLYVTAEISGINVIEFTDMHRDGCLTVTLSKSKLIFGTHATALLQMPQFCYKKVSMYMGLETVGFNILPEVKAFHEELKRKGQNLLYINLMRIKKHSTKCEETEHSDHIRSVLKHQKMNSIKMISLNRYSDVVTQKNVYSDKKHPNLCDWSYFLNHLLLNCSDFFCEIEGFNLEILKSIHKHYFDSKEKLNEDERRDFYELLLIEILTKYLEKYKFDFMTFACSTTTEESGSLNALLYVHQMVKQRGKITENDCKIIFRMLLANSLLITNSPGSVYYVSLFHSCANRMINKGVLSERS